MKYIHHKLSNLIGRFECTMVQIYIIYITIYIRVYIIYIIVSIDCCG